MNDIVKTHPFAPPAKPNADPYLAYRLATTRDGTTLKFTKEGTYRAGFGDDATTVRAGTRLTGAWSCWRMCGRAGKTANRRTGA
jgi:hypothetical protein